MRRASAGGLAVLVLCGLLLWPAQGRAQDVSLNYDTLSSLEEPIATNLGDVTIVLTGLVDLSLSAAGDSEDEDVDLSPGLVGNFEVSAETQLGNRWRVGAAYFGQYASDEFDSFAVSEGYTDNIAGFVGTSFGTVLGGNVSGQVRELTRRRRGVGHAALALDDFSANLRNWGVGYIGRFGPSLIGGAVDDEGNFDLGISYQRPRGQVDYRITGRVLHVGRSSFEEPEAPGTLGIAGVFEATYASSTFDVGLAYENLDRPEGSLDRWYVSAGARTQLGPWLFSAEGHYGRAAGQDELSLSAGAAFFVARGLSLNAGANYREIAPALLASGSEIRNQWQGLVSLRWSY